MVCPSGVVAMQSAILTRGAVRRTRRLRVLMEKLFAHVDVAARPTFKLRGNVAKFRRDALWFGRPDAHGRMPLYRVYPRAYGEPTTKAGLENATVPQRMCPELEDLLDWISTRWRLSPPLNHAVVHRYIEPDDTIGYHHDKHMDLARGSHIVSLSLGATRTFSMLDVATGATEDFEVRDGDLVAIPFELNRVAKHCVKPCRQAGQVRYSITARSMDSYFDPARRVFTHRHSGGVELPY